MIASACCISSNDSLRVYSASSVNPQFAYIFECRKYWLMAVSSLVNCSLSNFRTSGSPCIVAPKHLEAGQVSLSVVHHPT